MSQYNIGYELLGYKIIQEIGNGGMSDVYLALNPKFNPFDLVNDCKYVVIKVIKKEKPKSNNPKEIKEINDKWNKAIDEFKISSSLFGKVNDNVVKPIKWKILNDQIIIISEYIDGLTLNKYLDKYKLFNLERAIFYFKQILNGVRLFHKLSPNRVVIHRDLKPENIMFTNDLNTIKIIDYGIASYFYANSIDSSEGTIYCTADYTTPDILELKPQLMQNAQSGDKDAISKLNKIISVQFDFHSLGVILYYMITGELPFKYDKQKEKDVNIIKNWLKYDLPYIYNIPNSIQNIIFKCTASMPEDIKYRYHDIDEIINDINNWELKKDEKLIKPIEKRHFQGMSEVFNVENEKQKEKFYQKWYFFWICTVLVVAIIISVIVVMVVV